MAAGGGIAAVTFLSCAILLLPLVAAALIPENNNSGGQENGRKLRIINPFYLEPEMNATSSPPPGQVDPILVPEPVGPPEYGSEMPEPGKGQTLIEGFYGRSCPRAEMIVNQTINEYFSKDPTLAPAYVRLFLHDCLVNGCDASILLDETPSGEDVEKKAPHNGKFVRGFEAIDEIKSQLETECPGVVSCADILAYTNRDALVYTGVPPYQVAAGRRDGLVSLAKNVEHNIPLPDAPAEHMVKLFARKGLSLEELVVLTGAHSIGSAHCSVVSGRFFDPRKTADIDPGYLIKMRSLTFCEDDSQDLPFDPYSQQKMDSRFYKELLAKKALLESDQNLANEPRGNAVMKRYVGDQQGWLKKFTISIKKVGEMDVLTGDRGEIRRQCRFVN
ncbi:hypothetical protein ABFS83_05G020100 [Erythranthe nasuta]